MMTWEGAVRISACFHFPGTIENISKRTFPVFITRQPWPALAQASEEINPQLRGRWPASECLLFGRQNPWIVLWATLPVGSSSHRCWCWRGPRFPLPQNLKALAALLSTTFVRALCPISSLLWLVLFPHNKTPRARFVMTVVSSVSNWGPQLPADCHLPSQRESIYFFLFSNPKTPLNPSKIDFSPLAILFLMF